MASPAFNTRSSVAQTRRDCHNVVEALTRMTSHVQESLGQAQAEIDRITLGARMDAMENTQYRAEIIRLQAEITRLREVNARLRLRPRRPTCSECGEEGHRRDQCTR